MGGSFFLSLSLSLTTTRQNSSIHRTERESVCCHKLRLFKGCLPNPLRPTHPSYPSAEVRRDESFIIGVCGWGRGCCVWLNIFIRGSQMLLPPPPPPATHAHHPVAGTFSYFFTGLLIPDHCLSVDFTLMFRFCCLCFYHFIFPPFPFFSFLFSFFFFFFFFFLFLFFFAYAHPKI